ncbi:MAG: 50S ribosomal protein L19 [Candidatus Pacebacteria bacterium]|nr:50S ribosomal protein L19 [Candidatus Paceibacterota bacterium]
MTTKINNILKAQLRKDLPDVHPGDLIKVWQKVPTFAVKVKGKEQKAKERISPFEGLVIARKHGKGISATITVRAKVKGVGVEKVFPIHSPTITKIELIAKHKVRRAKLYYLRTAKGKRARLKRIEEKKTFKTAKVSDNKAPKKIVEK